MPPSAIIDTDLNPYDNTVLYVIEEGAIWKATTLGGGNATWAQVYDVADFDAALGSGLVLDRVRCAPATENLVYAIGHALKTDGVTYAEFCGRSQNGGTTWNWYEIGEVEDPGEGFTLGSTAEGTHNNTTTTFSGGGGSVICTVVFSGGSEGGNPFQWTSKNIEVILPDPVPLDPIDDSVSLEYDYIGDSPSLNYDTAGNCPAFIDYLTYIPIVEGSFSAITGGYHFTGVIHPSRMVDRSILHVGWHNDRTGRWANSTSATRTGTFCNLVINGVTYSAGISRAFDVARTNSNWLYYGTLDRIYKSEDGGVTWEILLEDTGAHDICVDPQISGAIYFWNVDGNLDLAVGDVVTSTALDTETPVNVPLRLARSLNSGRLWALNGGTALKMRNAGSWTSQGMGYSGATGLHAYLGDKLIFVEAGDIYISDDAGTTVTAKQGGWAAYANGINAHRMTATE